MLTRFSTDQKSGAIVVVLFGLLSVMANSVVLARTIWIFASQTSKLSREGFFFRTHLGVYTFCLLLSNLCTGLSGVLSVGFVIMDGITDGSLCNAQAVIHQIGNFGTPYFVLTMGIHTFNSLVLKFHQPLWVVVLVVLCGWLFSILIGVIPAISTLADGPIYGNIGFECGITVQYPVAHFLLQSLPPFLSAFVSAVAYSAVFLVLRGTLVMNGGMRLQLNAEQRWLGMSGPLEDYRHFVNALSRRLLWFPFAFTSLLVPSSIIQLIFISGFPVSVGSMSFAMVAELLFGLGSVLALYTVLHVFSTAIGTLSSPSKGSDTESFGNVEVKLSPVEELQSTSVPPRESRAFPPPKRSFDNLGSLPPKYTRSTSSLVGSNTAVGSQDSLHSRESSIADSTTHLIAPASKLDHMSTGIMSSPMTTPLLQRPITPIPIAGVETARRSTSSLVPDHVPPRELNSQFRSRPLLSGLNPRTTTGLPSTPRRVESPLPRIAVKGAPESSGVPASISPRLSSSSESSGSLLNLYLSRTPVDEPAPVLPRRSRRATMIKRVNFSLPLSHRDPATSGQPTIKTSASVAATKGPPPQPLSDRPKVEEVRQRRAEKENGIVDVAPLDTDSPYDQSTTPSPQSPPHSPLSTHYCPVSPHPSSAAESSSSTQVDVMSSLTFASLVATAATSIRGQPATAFVDVAGSSSKISQTPRNSDGGRGDPIPAGLQPRLPTVRMRREKSYTFRSGQRKTNENSVNPAMPPVLSLGTSPDIGEGSSSGTMNHEIVVSDVHATVRKVVSTTPHLETATRTGLVAMTSVGASARSEGKSTLYGYL